MAKRAVTTVGPVRPQEGSSRRARDAGQTDKDGSTRASGALTREHRDSTGQVLPGNPNAWQPGESGNPAGRPSSEREVTQAARALSLEGIAMLAEVMRDKRAQAAARVRAVEVVLERAYGRAPQKVVVETDVAGMDNSALAGFLRAKLEEVARTIEGEAEPV